MTEFFVDNLFPLLSAAAFLAAAIYAARNLLRVGELRRNGTRAPGTIIALRWSGGRSDIPTHSIVEVGSDSPPTRNVVFEFETSNRRIVLSRPRRGAGENDFHEGQRITVAYDPESPGRAEILDTDSRLRGGVQMVAVLVAGSVICVFLGVMS